MEVNNVVEVFGEILKSRYSKLKKYIVASVPVGVALAPLMTWREMENSQNEFGPLLAMNLPKYTIGAPVVVVVLIFAFTVFWFPSDVAKMRKHAYLQIIQILNLISPLTALTAWVVAVIWAIYPSNKSLADPLIGNPTGLSPRNTGDTAGNVEQGFNRGKQEEF